MSTVAAVITVDIIVEVWSSASNCGLVEWDWNMVGFGDLIMLEILPLYRSFQGPRNLTGCR